MLFGGQAMVQANDLSGGELPAQFHLLLFLGVGNFDSWGFGTAKQIVLLNGCVWIGLLKHPFFPLGSTLG